VQASHALPSPSALTPLLPIPASARPAAALTSTKHLVGSLPFPFFFFFPISSESSLKGAGQQWLQTTPRAHVLPPLLSTLLPPPPLYKHSISFLFSRLVSNSAATAMNGTRAPPHYPNHVTPRCGNGDDDDTTTRHDDDDAMTAATTTTATTATTRGWQWR
jgi:hypothetical protein